MKKIFLMSTFIFTFGLIIGISYTFAHPGNTDSSGCHTCRTNCTEKWGIPYGYYYRHNPVRPCSESTPSPTPSTPAPTPQPTSPSESPTTPAPEPKYETKTEKVTEEISFETKYEEDSDLEEGTTTVKQEGENGIKEKTFEVTYKDGIEVSRKCIDEKIAKNSVPKIIAKGTKKPEVKGASTKEQEGSTGSGLLGLLFVGGMGYLVFRFGKKLKAKYLSK